MKRSGILLISIGSLLIILAVLVSSVAVGAKTVTIKVLWPAYTEAKLRYGQYLKEAFEKLHPDIRVEMITDPSSVESKLTVLTAAGSPPDVGWMGGNWISFADKGFFMPLDRFIERDRQEVDPDDFISNVWNTYRWRRQMWMMPTGFTVSVFYYNRDLFQVAGLVDPKDNWTWDEMIVAAQKLTKDTDGDGKINRWGMNIWQGSYWSVLHYNGPLFNDEGTKANFDTPVFAWALKAIRDLVYTYRVQPTTAEVKALGGDQPMWFRGDLVGMYLGGAWALEPTKREADFDWDLVPMPVATVSGKKCRGTFYGPEGLYIHVDTKHPEEAWKFVKFAAGRETTEWAARQGHIVPGRNSAGPAFVKTGAPRNVRAFLISASFGVPWAAHPMWNPDINAAIAPIISDQIGAQPKVSPEVAASEIQRLVQGILDTWAKSKKK